MLNPVLLVGTLDPDTNDFNGEWLYEAPDMDKVASSLDVNYNIAEDMEVVCYAPGSSDPEDLVDLDPEDGDAVYTIQDARDALREGYGNSEILNVLKAFDNDRHVAIVNFACDVDDDYEDSEEEDE